MPNHRRILLAAHYTHLGWLVSPYSAPIRYRLVRRNYSEWIEGFDGMLSLI